jgi:hypothetical protein
LFFFTTISPTGISSIGIVGLKTGASKFSLAVIFGADFSSGIVLIGLN